ncbi:thioesterase family protein [Kiloniella laminariae]|uniref:Thioesterase family protein n=1 Tax=Kiloniella laminariae TaxID=454162 RepID=A0ABT4LEC2_9PROT|nr:thioesterase family protein [Kiloniella laminariae]MCZ4279270.1 thioesterase family protein [Kiloniella laminariae]
MKIQPRDVDPLVSYRGQVPADWLDYNGHMNVAYYMHVFCHGTDGFLEFSGADQNYRAQTGCSTFVVENHVNYMRELRLGAKMRVETRLLGFDRKKLSYHHTLFHDTEGYLAATSEWISVHVDLKQRQSCPMPDFLLKNLEEILEIQKKKPLPLNIGRSIMSWA